MWLISEKQSNEIKSKAQHLEVWLNQNFLDPWPVTEVDITIIAREGVQEFSGNVRTNSAFEGIFAVLLFPHIGTSSGSGTMEKKYSSKFCDLSLPFHDNLGGHNA